MMFNRVLKLCRFKRSLKYLYTQSLICELFIKSTSSYFCLYKFMLGFIVGVVLTCSSARKKNRNGNGKR